MHLRMAGWRQRLEQHTSCVTEELEEKDGIHTIEREACSRESHATVRMRTTLGEGPFVQVQVFLFTLGVFRCEIRRIEERLRCSPFSATPRDSTR